MANGIKISDPVPLLLRNFCGKARIPLLVELREYQVTTDRWHRHRGFYELVLVLAGQAVNDMEKESFTLRAGDIMLLSPDSVHRYRAIRNFQHYNVLFAPEALELLPGDPAALPHFTAFFDARTACSPLLHIDAKEMPQLVGILENIRKEFLDHQAGWEEAGFADFCRFLIRMLRHAASGSRAVSGTLLKIDRVLRLMENDPGHAFSLAELAAATHMSASSLRHHFREETGIAPIDYLIRLRLRRAALMMLNSDMPITEIAIQCGFSDGNYFARRFRCAFGTTPRNFRTMSRTGKLDFREELKKLRLR